MPRRTVSVTNVYVHTERKTADRKPIDNFDGKGADLLTLLRGFIANLDADLLVDNEHERYVTVTELEPAGRTLFCAVEAGWYGTSGKVTNVRTHALEHEHTEDSATTRAIRFVVVAPRGAKGMLVLGERVGGTPAATRVLSLFHLALRSKFDGEKLSFKVETMVESNAWLAKAELAQVTGIVNSYGYSSDAADTGDVKEIGRLRVELVPTGAREYLPKKVWQGLKNHNLKASEVLGLNDDLEVDNLQVKVSADGKTKTFAIEREKEPALSYLLTNRGFPDVDAFKSFCLDHAKDLLPNVGATWNTQINSGSWTVADLGVELKMPDSDE